MRITTQLLPLAMMATLLGACDNKATATDDPGTAHDHKMHDHKEHDHTGQATQGSANSSTSGLSDQKHFSVRYTPKPTPIPFQELFEVDIEVFKPNTTTPYAGVKLDEVRAVMPSHKHGMNVKPEIAELGPGRFKAKGMKFHMRGKGEHGLWVFQFVLRDGATVDTARFEVQCCAN